MSLDRHKMRKKLAAKSASDPEKKVSKTERTEVKKSSAVKPTKKTTRSQVPGQPKTVRTKTQAQAKVVKPKQRVEKPRVEKQRIEKPIVENKKPEKKKIKFPKLGKRTGQKPKARIFRSVKERSWLPLLGFILIVGGLTGFGFWYKSEEGKRLVGTLAEFQIPEKIEEFEAKNNSVLIPLIRNLDSCLPVIIAKYPEMKVNEKIASVALLQFSKNQQNMDILLDALADEDSRIAYTASISAGSLKGEVVPKLKEGISKLPPEKHKYIIFALGETKDEEAAKTLFEYLEKKETTTENKKYIVKTLSNFVSEKAIGGIISASIETDEDLHNQAILVLESHLRNNNLNSFAETFVPQIKSKMAQSKSDFERSRYIDVAAILALCQTNSGDNYINHFRNAVRNSMESKDEHELASATRALGVFRDSPFKEKFIKLLLHKSSNVVASAAEALIKLSDGEIPIELMEKPYTRRDSDDILQAIVQIFDHYHLHMVKNEQTERALDFLFEGLINKQNKDVLLYINTMLKYTELTPDMMKEEYRNKIHQLIFVGFDDKENLVSYSNALLRYAAIFPSKMEEKDFDQMMMLITKYPDEKLKLFGILERYVKNEPQNQIVDAMIRSLKSLDESNKKEMHIALEEYRKRQRGCHQKKEVKASFDSWNSWRQDFYKVEDDIAKAEKSIRDSKLLIRSKEKESLEEATKKLNEAKEMYQNIQKVTTYNFATKIQEIETLVYESNKAQGVK